MIRHSFSDYPYYEKCPEWWKNFVMFHEDLFTRSGELYFAIDRQIEKFNGRIIDEANNPDCVDYVEFETEYDFEAFKLYWTLYGK